MMPTPNHLEGKRILIVRLSSMGDVIHTLPAAATLKQSFPRSHVTWLVRPKWAPLLEGNPYIDEIVPLERTLSASIKTGRRLRHPRFDLAIDFQGLIQTGLLANFTRPEKLAGFHRKTVRERPAAWFYSTEVATQAAHAVDRNLELAAGAGALNTIRSFWIPQGEPEGSLPSHKFVLASPFAGWGAKQWTPDAWAEFAALLQKTLKMPLVVNGAPDSEMRLRQIPGAQVHLSGIAGLIDATRRAHAVIGLDSGPMHLAAALGKPGVALFGPTDPARHGPYGGSLHILRTPGAITDYHRSAEPAASMRALTPRMVCDALAANLDRKSTVCPA